jgi:hypothetical protein
VIKIKEPHSRFNSKSIPTEELNLSGVRQFSGTSTFAAASLACGKATLPLMANTAWNSGYLRYRVRIVAEAVVCC